MRQMTATLVVMLAGLSATACASRSADGGELANPTPSTWVEVTNNNWLDMTIYVVRGGARARLGTVVSMTSERFRLPRNALMSDGHIRLLASPIGSREVHGTPPILIQQGDRLSWQVENQLALSSFAVR